MRGIPLIGLTRGIDRLRVKGGARRNGLYDLTNAYINQEGVVVPREGTFRAQLLDSRSVGLVASNGIFNIFSTAAIAGLPSGYQNNILLHPTIAGEALKKIWFAQPFMGFLYVVAEFLNGDVFHYWLQSGGAWAANTVYTANSIVTPLASPNGFAYLAVRDLPQNPLWSANTQIALNDLVEPTEYTGYYYKAVAVSGSNAFTGSIEPNWPSDIGAQVQEFGDFSISSSAASSAATSGNIPTLSQTITDRYGDSSTVANAGNAADTTTTSAQASTVVTTWQAGTTYAPGSVVKPSTSQGAYIDAIPNGDFEAGNVDWTLDAGWSITTNSPYQGSYAAYFLHTGSGFFNCTMSTGQTVSPGQKVTANGYGRGDSDGAIFFMLRWYDGSGVHISDTTGAKVSGGGGSNPTNYSPGSVTGTAPANAATVKFAIQYQTGSSSARSGWADLVSWSLEQPAAVSNLYYEAVQASAAASGSTEPTWPTIVGDTVVDGGVTWKAIGTSIITWQAFPIMESGAAEPAWPTAVGEAIPDGSMSWVLTSRQITDAKCPNTKGVVLGASHVFAVDNDIVSYSAAVDPTDWSSANNAGYLPTGLNNYGNNPMEVLGLFRSNLVAFNSGGYQMWQIDPDPANMALLDAEPVGSIYTRAGQSVANDYLFLSEVGVRNLEVVGITANLQIGNTGQPVDTIVQNRLNQGLYDPISLYYPGRGQYWLIFGPEALVLTMNGAQTKTWSRYVFPYEITDWTFNEGQLYLRTSNDLIWQFSDEALYDDISTQTSSWVFLEAQSTGAANFGYNSSAGYNIGNVFGNMAPTTFGSVGNVVGLYNQINALNGGTAPGFVFLEVQSNNTTSVPQNAFTDMQLVDANGVYWSLSSASASFSGGQASNNYVSTWSWEWLAYPGGPSFGDPYSPAPSAGTNTANIGVTFTSVTGGGITTVPFNAIIQWPYIGIGPFGANKELIGVDITGDGAVSIQIGYNEADPTSFSDNAGFGGSSSITITAGKSNTGIQWLGFDSGVGVIGVPTGSVNGPSYYGVAAIAEQGTTALYVSVEGGMNGAPAKNEFMSIAFTDANNVDWDLQSANATYTTNGTVGTWTWTGLAAIPTFTVGQQYVISFTPVANSSVTTSYTVDAADTVPGTPIPLPLTAPSMSPMLTFASGQAWTLEAVNLYVNDNRGAGALG